MQTPLRCISFSCASVLTAALSLGFATNEAHAQAAGRAATPPSQPSAERLAARRQLIADASAAQQQNRHNDALNLAQQAATIQLTPSLQMLIAQEQNALGQLAAALGSAEVCARDASRDATLRNRDAIIGTCNALLQSIRAKVGYLTVRSPSPAPSGLVVSVAGTVFGSDLYDLPYPIAAGTIVVEAHAPGMLPFRSEVVVAAGSRGEVKIELGVDDHAPTRAAPSSGPGVAPWILIGVGVASMAVGGVMYGMQLSSLAGCSVMGDTAYCDSQQALNTAMSAPTFNTVGTATMIAGGVLAAAGVVWFAVGTATSRRETTRVGLQMSPWNASVVVRF